VSVRSGHETIARLSFDALASPFPYRILGLADVQHAFADRLSEVMIGYPESPLNAGSSRGLNGPGPGQRILGSKPFGAGDQPRFALMAAEEREGARAVLQDVARLLEAKLREPPNDAGVWVVRADSYVFAAARAGEGSVIRVPRNDREGVVARVDAATAKDDHSEATQGRKMLLALRLDFAKSARNREQRDALLVRELDAGVIQTFRRGPIADAVPPPRAGAMEGCRVARTFHAAPDSSVRQRHRPKGPFVASD
jgi:hypothetical protein